jgi:dynein heavy chain
VCAPLTRPSASLCACCVRLLQVMWARGTEQALNSDGDRVAAMGLWLAENVRQLSQLTALVRGKLTKLERGVIVALVTTDVHARDIVEQLFEAKVDKVRRECAVFRRCIWVTVVPWSLGGIAPSLWLGTHRPSCYHVCAAQVANFTWQQQLRYYFDRHTDIVVVRQSNSVINYGYEYQGCTSRLVITPLTDRCWMTITGAVSLKLGAQPAGPAGTGKVRVHVGRGQGGEWAAGGCRVQSSPCCAVCADGE